jgi:hypothetical protein
MDPPSSPPTVGIILVTAGGEDEINRMELKEKSTALAEILMMISPDSEPS